MMPNFLQFSLITKKKYPDLCETEESSFLDIAVDRCKKMEKLTKKVCLIFAFITGTQ
jgi:hypothetical protein